MGVESGYVSSKSYVDEIKIENASQFTDYMTADGDVIFDFKVPLAKAKEAKENASIFFEGYLAKPYFHNKTTTSAATLSSPYETTIVTRKLHINISRILIKNNITGDLIAQIEAKNKKTKMEIIDLNKEFAETKRILKNVFPEMKKNAIFNKQPNEREEEYFLRIRNYYKDKEIVLTSEVNDLYYDDLNKTMGIRGLYNLLRKNNVSISTPLKSCIPMSSDKFQKIQNNLAVSLKGFPSEVAKNGITFFVDEIFVFDKNTGEIYNQTN